MYQLLRSLALPAVLSAAIGHLSSDAAPFTNGSLESTSSALIETIASGNSAHGWDVSGANIDFVSQGYSFAGDTFAAPHHGSWMVDLNGNQGPGTISQTFDTIAGQQYLISFWMSGNAGPDGITSADDKTLSVSWDSTQVATATYTHQLGDNWSNLRWENHSVVVTALASSSTLSFTSTSTTYPEAGPLLDDITVTLIPEPRASVAALAVVGLLTVTLLRRRRE